MSSRPAMGGRQSEERSLSGHTALITGAARGQGLSHAKRLASDGARVIAGDVLDDKGHEAITNLRQAGLDVTYRHLDVSDEHSWQDITEEFPTIDILVNNAGIIHVTSLAEESLHEWQQLISVNLTGTFLGIRSVIPLMQDSGGGSIINIASIFGPGGVEGYSAYASSKSGVLGLTRTSAVELAPMGIRVNAISPGGVESPMNDGEKAGGVIPETPLRRRAKPSEISAAVAYLASPEASFTTGANIVVDGGFLAR